MQKFLIIQTAFIGDVVLATGLIEKLHSFFPDAQIDFLVRKGNEGLLQNHPYLRQVLVWDKKKEKYSNLFRLLKQIQKEKYNKVINVQRYAATGLLTAFSGAKCKIGFDKNPWSFLFTEKIRHTTGTNESGIHEIERNNTLIASFTNDKAFKPKLYPTQQDYEAIKQYQSRTYICIAPSSVWFTKQYPKEKWVNLINKLPSSFNVYLLGAPSDEVLCGTIIKNTSNKNVYSLAGKLSMLQSAALQQNAYMNYVNDSAPMHFASAMNAPVTAVYCSTIPSFGYGPLSDKSFIVETKEQLECRPCGIHGHKECPQKHFKCALTIQDEQLLAVLNA